MNDNDENWDDDIPHFDPPKNIVEVTEAPDVDSVAVPLNLTVNIRSIESSLASQLMASCRDQIVRNVRDSITKELTAIIQQEVAAVVVQTLSEPLKITDRFGSSKGGEPTTLREIIVEISERFWTSSSNYHSDNPKDKIIKEICDSQYKKLAKEIETSVGERLKSKIVEALSKVI